MNGRPRDAWTEVDVDMWQLFGAKGCWAEAYFDEDRKHWMWEVFDAGGSLDHGDAVDVDDAKRRGAERLAQV